MQGTELPHRVRGTTVRGAVPPIAAVRELGGDDLRTTVARALAGERAAADVLYRRFYASVLAIQLAFTGGDRQLAADLTQDTFVKVLYRLDRFEWRGPTSLRSWIATIARNTFRDHVRSAAERHHGGYDVPDAPDVDDHVDPVEVAVRDLDGARVLAGRVLEQLKDEHRYVLQRMLGDGATAAQVAAELRRSEAAVHQLKRRALDAARRCADPSPAAAGSH